MVRQKEACALRNAISRLKELTRRQIAALRSQTFNERLLTKVPVTIEPNRLNYVMVKRNRWDR